MDPNFVGKAQGLFPQVAGQVYGSQQMAVQVYGSQKILHAGMDFPKPKRESIYEKKKRELTSGEFASNNINYHFDVNMEKVQNFALVPQQERMHFTDEQAHILQAFFSSSTSHPSQKDMLMLGAMTGTSEDQVKVWFQNRRAKARRDSEAEQPLEPEQKRLLALKIKLEHDKKEYMKNKVYAKHQRMAERKQPASKSLAIRQQAAAARNESFTDAQKAILERERVRAELSDEQPNQICRVKQESNSNNMHMHNAMMTFMQQHMQKFPIPAQQASQQPTQQAGPQAIQQTTQQPTQQPYQQPIQQPCQQPTHQPSQQPIQQQSQQPIQQPNQQPIQQPSQQLNQQQSQQLNQQDNQQSEEETPTNSAEDERKQAIWNNPLHLQLEQLRQQPGACPPAAKKTKKKCLKRKRQKRSNCYESSDSDATAHMFLKMMNQKQKPAVGGVSSDVSSGAMQPWMMNHPFYQQFTSMSQSNPTSQSSNIAPLVQPPLLQPRPNFAAACQTTNSILPQSTALPGGFLQFNVANFQPTPTTGGQTTVGQSTGGQNAMFPTAFPTAFSSAGRVPPPAVGKQTQEAGQQTSTPATPLSQSFSLNESTQSVGSPGMQKINKYIEKLQKEQKRQRNEFQRERAEQMKLLKDQQEALQKQQQQMQDERTQQQMQFQHFMMQQQQIQQPFQNSPGFQQAVGEFASNPMYAAWQQNFLANNFNGDAECQSLQPSQEAQFGGSPTLNALNSSAAVSEPAESSRLLIDTKMEIMDTSAVEQVSLLNEFEKMIGEDGGNATNIVDVTGSTVAPLFSTPMKKSGIQQFITDNLDEIKELEAEDNLMQRQQPSQETDQQQQMFEAAFEQFYGGMPSSQVEQLQYMQQQQWLQQQMMKQKVSDEGDSTPEQSGQQQNLQQFQQWNAMPPSSMAPSSMAPSSMSDQAMPCSQVASSSQEAADTHKPASTEDEQHDEEKSQKVPEEEACNEEPAAEQEFMSEVEVAANAEVGDAAADAADEAIGTIMSSSACRETTEQEKDAKMMRRLMHDEAQLCASQTTPQAAGCDDGKAAAMSKSCKAAKAE